MPPPWIFSLSAFTLGLLFGSFLNVCISRLPRHESILHPRSHCPTCGHTIRWYDNIPLLSFLLLRARCRDCRAPIPWRYPIVEFALASWFYLVARSLAHASPVLSDQLIQTLALAILGFLLIGLLVMDWQTHRLPDAFTLTGIALGFLLTCAQAIFLSPGQGDVAFNPTHQLRLSSPGSFAARGNVFLTGTEALVFGRIASIAAGALLLLAVRWIYRAIRHHDGMGLGDVKLLAMLAAFLGLPLTLLSLFLGVLTATLYALVLLARRRATPATRLPFGSFLALGGLYAALHGQPLLNWYTSLFHP